MAATCCSFWIFIYINTVYGCLAGGKVKVSSAIDPPRPMGLEPANLQRQTPAEQYLNVIASGVYHSDSPHPTA